MVSTKTLLDVVNDVLLTIGEVRVATTSKTSTSVKCLNAVKDALHDVQTAFDWSWLMADLVSAEWVDDRAVLPVPVQRIRAVYSLLNITRYPVRFIEKRLYDQIYKYGWSGETNLGCQYTLDDDGAVYVNPYPTTTESKERVIFSSVLYISAPTIDSGHFDVPDLYLPLIEKRASVLMAERHLDDPNAIQYLDTEYMRSLTQARARQTRTPTTGYNMFRQLR